MKQKIVAREVAEQEFERFVEEMDLLLDTSTMDAEDLTAFNLQKERLLVSIERGDLVINEKGEAVYTPRNERSNYLEPITFHERTGASLMAMDGKKKGHDVGKMYSVLADMCRVHPKVFTGLAGTDVKVCEALFALLMG